MITYKVHEAELYGPEYDRLIARGCVPFSIDVGKSHLTQFRKICYLREAIICVNCSHQSLGESQHNRLYAYSICNVCKLHINVFGKAFNIDTGEAFE